MDPDALVGAFLGALDDELAAASTGKGDATVTVLDGRRVRRRADGAAYSFALEHPIAAADDVPVELRIGAGRYPGSILHHQGTELIIWVRTTGDLGASIPRATLATNLAFVTAALRQGLENVLDVQRTPGLGMAHRVFREPPVTTGRVPDLPVLETVGGRAPNASQVAAIRLSQTLPLTFVWGPPGTGKTATVARIAETFAKRGKRVLVVAPSNVAVDEATARIATVLRRSTLYEERRILRFGVHRNEALEAYDRVLLTRVTDALPRHADPATIRELQRVLLTRARIVCTTLTQTFLSSVLPEVHFDALILDEGSMAPLVQTFWALTRCTESCVVAGDFQQLAPVCLATTDRARTWLGGNLYEYFGLAQVARAAQDARVQLLDVQYRMAPEISAIPNRLFYGGLLRDHPTTHRPRTHRDGGLDPLVLVDTSDVSPWCLRLSRGSRITPHHALVAAGIVRMIGASDRGRSAIGVVTPFTAQTRLIAAALADFGLQGAARVSTVHRSQGGEMPVLLFDSAEAPGAPVAPMLSGRRDAQAQRLLNVALTRAQRQLVLIGQAAHLTTALPQGAVLAQIVTAFEHQAQLIASRPLIDALLASPRAAEAGPEAHDFLADLAGAREEISLITPTLPEAWLTALEQAARRGLRVVLVTPGADRDAAHWSGSVARALQRCRTAGMRIREYVDVHQAMAAIDGRALWLGGYHAPGTPRPAPLRLTAPAMAHEIARMLEEDVSGFAHLPGSTERAPASIGTVEVCPISSHRLSFAVTPDGPALVCADHACPYRRPVHAFDRITTDRPCGICGRPLMIRLGSRGVFAGCSGFPKCRATVPLWSRR